MINLDSLLIKKTTSGEKAKAPPEKGFARFFYLAYTHFAKLVGLNLLFLLFCIPVITIPAALSGMYRVSILLVREGTAGVWSDFIGEFKASFVKSLPLGVVCAFFFADAALCVWLSFHTPSAGVAAALLAAALLLTLFSILLSCYAFVLLSYVALRSSDILRNTLILILTQPKANLLLILIAGGSIAAAAWFLPYSIPVISILGPALLSLAVCTAVRGPVERLIVEKTNQSM